MVQMVSSSDLEPLADSSRAAARRHLARAAPVCFEPRTRLLAQVFGAVYCPPAPGYSGRCDSPSLQLQRAAARDLDASSRAPRADQRTAAPSPRVSAGTAARCSDARVPRPSSSAAVVDADARLVSFEVLAPQEPHVIGGDDRRRTLARRGAAPHRCTPLRRRARRAASRRRSGRRRAPASARARGAHRGVRDCQQRAPDVTLLRPGQRDQTRQCSRPSASRARAAACRVAAPRGRRA